MPTTTEVDYLDNEFTVNETEPSTIAELTEMIGEEAVVENVNANLRYRNKNQRVYKKVSAEVEKTFPRAVKETKTSAGGTVKEIKVSFIDHLREFLKTGDAARKTLGELFNRIGNEEQMFVKGERAGGGGKISEAAQNAAIEFINEGEDKVAAVVAAIESETPGYKVGRDADGNPTVESIARGIQAMQKYALQKAQQGLFGKLKAAA